MRLMGDKSEHDEVSVGTVEAVVRVSVVVRGATLPANVVHYLEEEEDEGGSYFYADLTRSIDMLAVSNIFALLLIQMNLPRSLAILKEVSPGEGVAFTVRATGTEPLSYQWQWKPAEEGDGSEEWQPCDAEEAT